MTDDEHAMLTYLVGKQAKLDAVLKAAIPLILRHCSSADPETQKLGNALVKAHGELSTPLIETEIKFLEEQFPSDAQVIRQMVSLSERDAGDSMKP